MEHQEKLKIIDELDADLQSDIEHIRKRKVGRNKSSTAFLNAPVLCLTLLI